MRFLFRLAMLVIAIVLVVFAVSNRGTIALGLWPLPDVLEVPLYLIMLGCLLVGFLAGEFAAWNSARHWRREVRRSARRIAALEREIDTVRAERAPASGPARLAG